MIKLPKLIEEKIRVYMNYINYQSWRKSIEDVHKEYNDRVYREDDPILNRYRIYYKQYYWGTYRYDYVFQKYDYYYNLVVSYSKIEHRRIINTFRRHDKEYVGLRVPENYVYSSGYPNVTSFTDPISRIEDLLFG